MGIQIGNCMMFTLSEACERNKDPILEILRDVLRNSQDVLEIGSGTGQHAVYFGQHLPYLTWQTSDLTECHGEIRERLEKEGLSNVKLPLSLDVCRHPWPVASTSAIFTANTLHIMSWDQVKHLFKGIGETLQTGGIFCIYGPFRYHGTYTSESNARFDQFLQMEDPLSGIRDFEAVNQLACEEGLSFIKDYSMPSNNQTLIWKR